MGCPLLSWQTCTPHGRGGLVPVTVTIATPKQVASRSLPDPLPALCPSGRGAFVRETAVAPYAVVVPRAPVLKTHHYPNLQLTQIDL
jgi:hypothetical protein